MSFAEGCECRPGGPALSKVSLHTDSHKDYENIYDLDPEYIIFSVPLSL